MRTGLLPLVLHSIVSDLGKKFLWHPAYGLIYFEFYDMTIFFKVMVNNISVAKVLST